MIIPLIALFVAVSAQPKSATATALNRFGVTISQRIAKAGQNFFVSPASMFSAVGMLMAADADTKAAVRKSLLLDDGTPTDDAFWLEFRKPFERDANSQVKTVLANSFWPRRSALSDTAGFEATLQRLHGATTFPINETDGAQSVALLKEWVTNATRGVITEAPVTSFQGIIAMLVNAVYFKGDWTVPFDKALTEEKGKFALCSGGTVEVPLMYLNSSEASKRKKNAEVRFDYALASDHQAIRLPYGNQSGDGQFEFYMRVMLPTNGDVDALLASLSAEKLAQVLFKPTKGELWLPRFSLDWGFERITAAFSPALPVPPLFAPADLDVVHKARVSVDEEGAEAAAVTALFFATSVAINPPKEPFFSFRANRPFLFAIEHATNGILFMGKVNALGSAIASTSPSANCKVKFTEAPAPDAPSPDETTTSLAPLPLQLSLAALLGAAGASI
jgi:serine protease inhibitor